MAARALWLASTAQSIKGCRYDQRAERAALKANTADRTMAMTVQTVGLVHSSGLVELTVEGQLKMPGTFPDRNGLWLATSHRRERESNRSTGERLLLRKI